MQIFCNETYLVWFLQNRTRVLQMSLRQYKWSLRIMSIHYVWFMYTVNGLLYISIIGTIIRFLLLEFTPLHYEKS